jgi:hypothetical protein
MNKGIGIALLVARYHIDRLWFQCIGLGKFEVCHVLSLGRPQTKALWLLLGGGAAAIVGAVMTFRPSGKV